MFAVTVTFDAAPGRAAELLARLRRQAADSLTRETGCLRFDVLEDSERPGHAFLYELYTTRAAFDAHLASTHFKAFDREVAPMIAAKSTETWRLVA